jgi:outer membrane protein assembly factor BamB
MKRTHLFMIPKFPFFLTLLFGGLLAWLWLTDHVFRSGGLMILIPLWLILMGLWWALRQRGVRLKRLGLLVLGCIAVVAGFRYCVRYEGSADGSAFPSLGWRWQKQHAMPELHSIAGAATAPAEVPAGVADMPRFLGAKGDGVLPEPDWQTDWKAHPPREMWRIKVGDGWAGFAVAGSRAITQEQRGTEECVTCYDIATGKLLWSHADEVRFDEAMGGIGPRSTPTVDVTQNVVFTIWRPGNSAGARKYSRTPGPRKAQNGARAPRP